MLKGFLKYYDENDPPQGGGETGDDPPAGKVRASDLRSQLGQNIDEQALMRLLEKQADLLSDNHKLREKLRARPEVPKGARVLSADEATAYDAYVALGKPDELSTKLTTAEQAAADLTTLRRDATLRDVRDATGYDLDVLKDIGGAEWQYTIKEETIDEKPAKVVYVKDGDQEQRIDQHPKVQRFLPALRPSGMTPPPGQPYPRQNGGTPPPAGDLATRFIQQQEERRKAQINPLMPKQGA